MLGATTLAIFNCIVLVLVVAEGNTLFLFLEVLPDTGANGETN